MKTNNLVKREWVLQYSKRQKAFHVTSRGDQRYEASNGFKVIAYGDTHAEVVEIMNRIRIHYSNDYKDKADLIDSILKRREG